MNESRVSPALGGMTGCPQITLPLATVDGLPVGLSLMAAQRLGRDADALRRGD